ncbi:MAG TPA: hypothetical protein EYN96_09695, partial [Candidatus Hydrogenedentes bacterium]|nr:hypothetical protein [Candidatus Hydrogenedentota bacterium]
MARHSQHHRTPGIGHSVPGKSNRFPARQFLEKSHPRKRRHSTQNYRARHLRNQQSHARPLHAQRQKTRRTHRRRTQIHSAQLRHQSYFDCQQPYRRIRLLVAGAALRMSDISKIPYLIRLLDDDSPMVQHAIRKELDAFGDELDDALASIDQPTTPEQWDQLELIRADQRRARLLEEWPSCFKIENSYVQLETAFSLISDYMSLHVRRGELTRKLNALADKFRAERNTFDSYDLARFLFKTEDFRGCQSGYYTPDKSNLLATIQLRSGNPISLTCIFMLIGYRLDLPIHGCNFPGHFLGIATVGNERVLVD